MTKLSTREIYFRETIEAVLNDMGKAEFLTSEQLDELASAVAMSAEMYGEYSGEYNIPNPLQSRVDELQRQVKDVEENAERRADALKAKILAHYPRNMNLYVAETYNGVIVTERH